MLAQITDLKSFIGVPPSDSSQDSKLLLCLLGADRAVKKFCKQAFEFQLNVWYPPERALGGEAIVLPETPVVTYQLTGNITNGLATITGLSSTTGLVVGMTAVVTTNVNNQTMQPFPNGATIQSIQAPSQVTLTGAATQSIANATIIFGLSMWWDPSGVFGTGQGTDAGGPYGATTFLYPGIDYALQIDSVDGVTSKSGKIIRLGNVMALAGMAGTWNSFGGTWGGLNARGTLTANLKPIWPNWPPGALKVLFASGYTSIPSDLTVATCGLAAWMWQNSMNGLLQTGSESFNGESYGIAALQKDPSLGSVRQILSRYKKVSM